MRAAPPIDVRPLHELVAEFTAEIARDCQCGSKVIANPTDPTRGVQAHRLSEPHASWARKVYTEWQP